MDFRIMKICRGSWAIGLRSSYQDPWNPTFDAGDVIVIEKAEDTGNLQKGDVITYLVIRQGDNAQDHQRTEHEGKTAYVTKGDYNNVEDRLACIRNRYRVSIRDFASPIWEIS